jgi:hypothetical protein
MVHAEAKGRTLGALEVRQMGGDVAQVLEERGRCLRSWFSMEELFQPHTGELWRVVLRRPVELTGTKQN